MEPSVVGVLRLFAAGVLACAGAARAAAETCPAAGDGPVVLAAVEPGLELRLADGRLVRLSGVEPASGTPTDPDLGDTARAALADLLRGHRLALRAAGTRPDRWGRIVAFAFAEDGPLAGRAGGVATVALEAWLGRFLPEPSARACRAALLAAEDVARRGGLGLWHDPYYSVLAADAQADFAERAGGNVVVEARLVSVEPGLYRTTLRFAASDQGPRAARRVSATILPRAMKMFEAQGVDFTSLIGRTLRLRGLLDERFGPQIELAGPDAVEVVVPPVAPPTRPK